MKNNVFEILLVEDNPDDVELTKEALKENRIQCSLSVAVDGIDAMNFLKKKGGYINSPVPDIILLDLNLPKKDGREVLAEIKKDEVLKGIPVIIMTTSSVSTDILRTYELHANCYVNKSVDLDEFIECIRKMMTFWFKTALLPGSFNR